LAWSTRKVRTDGVAVDAAFVVRHHRVEARALSYAYPGVGHVGGRH
jgi:hypothetical protein